MASVVVIGAGIAGLGIAAFASRRGHTVTIIERDAAPLEGASPDEEVSDWQRPGVPHARQGHAMLGLGISVLRQEYRPVIDDLVARGAVLVDLDTGGDDLGLLVRRLVFEATLRRRVEADSRVIILQARVVGLVAEVGADGVPHVLGVRLDDGSEMSGDIVLDASGRRSPSATWLSGIGAQAPREIAQACGFSYIAQEFALNPGCSFPSLRAPIVHELDYATVLAFPGDNGRFHLSTTISAKDPLRRRLLEPRIYARFLASVEPVRKWLEVASPVSAPLPMAGLENRRRSLAGPGGPIVTGFAYVGDACVQTNPTFGRGVSLALAHARTLADALDRIDQDPRTWTMDMIKRTEDCLGLWFEHQLATDAARLDELTNGTRSHSVAARIVTAMAVLREQDEHVRRVADRVYHMLLTPQQMMADRAVSRQVLAFIREHPDVERSHVGPTRADFERLAEG